MQQLSLFTEAEAPEPPKPAVVIEVIEDPDEPGAWTVVVDGDEEAFGLESREQAEAEAEDIRKEFENDAQVRDTLAAPRAERFAALFEKDRGGQRCGYNAVASKRYDKRPTLKDLEAQAKAYHACVVVLHDLELPEVVDYYMVTEGIHMVCPADKPGHDISNGGTEFFRLLDRLPKDAAEHLVRSHEITIGHALNKKHKAKLHDDGLPRKRPCLACGKSFDVGTWSYGKVCCSNKCYRDADARGLDWTSTPAAPKPAPAELPWLAWNEKGIIVAAPGHKPTSESAARKLGRNARWLRLQDLEPVIRIASGMRDFQLMDFFLDLKLHTIETAPTGAGPLTWTSPEVAKRFYTADALRETAGDGATPAAKKPPKKAKPAPAAPIRKRDELTPTDPTEKSCPNCGRTGNIDTEFGWRTMNGKRKPQSRCKKCR